MESDVIVFLSCGSEHPDCIFDIALDLSSRSFILWKIEAVLVRRAVGRRTERWLSEETS